MWTTKCNSFQSFALHLANTIENKCSYIESYKNVLLDSRIKNRVFHLKKSMWLWPDFCDVNITKYITLCAVTFVLNIFLKNAYFPRCSIVPNHLEQPVHIPTFFLRNVFAIYQLTLTATQVLFWEPHFHNSIMKIMFLLKLLWSKTTYIMCDGHLWSALVFSVRFWWTFMTGALYYTFRIKIRWKSLITKFWTT